MYPHVSVPAGCEAVRVRARKTTLRKADEHIASTADERGGVLRAGRGG